MNPATRRRVLSAGAAAMALLAGCSGGGSDDGTDDTGDGTGASPTGGTVAGTTTAAVVEPLDDGVVEMNDELQFVPAAAAVPAGTTVTWENVGDLAHSVTAYAERIPDGAEYFASGGFESEAAARDAYADGGGEVAGGERYQHTFETPGTYEYFCIPHERGGMKGTVEVR